jgi:hypothetical protein
MGVFPCVGWSAENRSLALPARWGTGRQRVLPVAYARGSPCAVRSKALSSRSRLAVRHQNESRALALAARSG